MLYTGGLGQSVLKSNDVVAGLHGGDALADRLDDTGTLMTEDDGESTFGVLSGEGVGVCELSVPAGAARERERRTSVADTSVVDLNADFVSLGGSDLDVLNGEGLAGSPGNGGLEDGQSDCEGKKSASSVGYYLPCR